MLLLECVDVQSHVLCVLFFCLFRDPEDRPPRNEAQIQKEVQTLSLTYRRICLSLGARIVDHVIVHEVFEMSNCVMRKPALIHMPT